MREISESELSLLATKLGAERAQEIQDSFFQKTNAKTFAKWFGGEKPYLDMEKHGGAYVENDDGTYQYYMIARSRYKMRKVGKRYKPYKSHMAAATREAASLTMRTLGSEVTSKDGKKIRITLHYEGMLPPDYHGEISGEAGGGNGWQPTEKKGKISSLDRLLLRAIGKWSEELGIKVRVDSVYRGDKR